MIFDFLFSAMTYILNFIIGLFPTIPAIPEAFVTVGDFIISIASQASGFIKYVMSDAIFYAFLSVIVVVLAWDNIVTMVKLILKLTLISKLLARF